jgi:diguanylate cyclase (GGDEF)-like protein
MYELITLSLIISVFVALFSIFIVWKNRQSAGGAELIIMLLMNIIWSSSAYFELSTHTLNDKYFWTKMEYLGSSMMCTLWFVFIMKYLGLRIPLFQNRKWMLFIIPALTLLLVWTNEHHLLIHAKMHLSFTRGLHILVVDKYGPAFYLFLIYSWLMMAASIFICFFSATFSKSITRKQLRLLAFTALIPLIFNVIYIFRIGMLKYFDLTPVSFSIMGILLSYALTKYRLVDLAPVAVHTIFDHIMDGLIVLNEHKHVMEINPAGRTILQVNSKELYGSNINKLIPQLPDFTEIDIENINNSIIIGDSWYDVHISPMLHNKTLRGWVLTLRDITTKKEMEERLHRLAFYDIITNLPNRMLFYDRLNTELARIQRTNKKIAILFIDLDGFKNINDTLGHKVGDIVLHDTANKLHKCMRETDMVARIGGDEFVIMLTDITEEHYAENCAERILIEIAKPAIIEEHTIQTSVSIGITVTTNNFTTPDELIRHADEAMYHAKENGKNQFNWYSPNSAALMDNKSTVN